MTEAGPPALGVVRSLARRRAERDRREAMAATDAYHDAGRDLHRTARAHLAAGHPELARPYLEEAELFDGAALRAIGL